MIPTQLFSRRHQPRSSNGVRSDVWKQTEGVLQTVWFDNLITKITLGGTTKYMDGALELPGSFTSTDLYKFHRELVLTDTFDSDHGNLWRKVGVGTGQELIDNTYSASGQNTFSTSNSSGTLVGAALFSYTTDYRTDRALEYQKPETTRAGSSKTTSEVYQPTFSPMMTAFVSTGWISQEILFQTDRICKRGN